MDTTVSGRELRCARSALWADGGGRNRRRAGSIALRILALPAFLVFLVSAAMATEATDRLVARGPIAAPEGFAGVCARYTWACATGGRGQVAGAAALVLAKAVNSRVNREVPQLSDRQQYGTSDTWALPSGRGGDCEDIVLLKKQELVESGLRAETLLMATALDRRRSPHAVLILRSERGDLVLDSLTDRIRPWSETGYTFLRMQNPRSPGQWDAVIARGTIELAGS